MAQKTQVIELLHGVLSYHDDRFYDLVRDHCGPIVEEMVQIRKITSVQSLLRTPDIFEFMNYPSVYLDEIKEKVAFRLTNGEYKIKCRIKADVDLFLQSLIHINDKLSQSKLIQSDVDRGLYISEDLLLKHPVLSSLVKFYSREQDNIDQNSMLFLNSFMDNLLQNLSRTKSSYRFNDYVKKFSVVFFYSCWS
jgi:hypothetical protein